MYTCSLSLTHTLSLSLSQTHTHRHTQTHPLQEHDDVGIVWSDAELHGDLQERPHHGDVCVAGWGQGNPQVLTDLSRTLQENVVELLAGDELLLQGQGKRGEISRRQ